MTADSLCIACGVNPLPVVWSDSWGEYRGGMERVLHAFKFERHDFLADALARLLEEVVMRHAESSFDVVVPVPMHRTKERRRGYNQAELLAVSLARRLGVLCDRRLLTKTSERATQSTLARAARAANVRDVFAGHDRVRGLQVLLVDDISTTGETFRACAAELLRSGAASVAAVAVAKAT
jgi:competence protein ComFC